MSVDMRIDMYIDMCIDMYIDIYIYRCEHVYRHLHQLDQHLESCA